MREFLLASNDDVGDGDTGRRPTVRIVGAGH